MKKVFIHSASCISVQNTFDSEGFLDDILDLSEKTASAHDPNYKEYIAPAASRRMAPVVKMGVTAASKALENANLKQPNGIITGTGMGCLEDTEKFLNNLIANDEEFLTPTAFVQSTHNTVGAQIALGLKCKAYNNTYVHAAVSFESALLDAQLLLEQNEAKHILVGGFDELGKEMVRHIRMMEDAGSNGIKVPLGEGASFFVLSSEANENAIQLMDIEIFSSATEKTTLENLNRFLNRNAIEPSEVDALILGRNGDFFDLYYDTIASFFNVATELHYKHLSGEYYTASSFGLWAAYQILERQTIPEALVFKGNAKPDIQNILLYNQFKGRDHSFILLKR